MAITKSCWGLGKVFMMTCNDEEGFRSCMCCVSSHWEGSGVWILISRDALIIPQDLPITLLRISP